MAWASTVAVVVPSPALSLVLVATCSSSLAPMFSNGSSSSISRAMVTPSFTTSGAPNFFSSTTLRPLGPMVTFTASARAFTPRSREAREASEKESSLAIAGVCWGSALRIPSRRAPALVGKAESSRLQALPGAGQADRVRPMDDSFSDGLTASLSGPLSEALADPTSGSNVMLFLLVAGLGLGMALIYVPLRVFLTITARSRRLRLLQRIRRLREELGQPVQP